MNDIAICTSEWIEEGCPSDAWFTIVRQEIMDCVDENTPLYLASLIRIALQNYGDFETRRTQFIYLDNYWLFKDKYNNEFIMLKSIGIVNTKETEVVSMYIDAKII